MGGSLALCASLLPGAVVLIRLLCTRWHLFLSLLLALLQLEEFLGSLLWGELLLEDGIVQIEQVVGSGGTGVEDALLVVRRGVHLGLCEHREAHLVLQNRLPTLVAAHRMQAVVG